MKPWRMTVVLMLAGSLFMQGGFRTVEAAMGDGSAHLSLPYAPGQTWALLGGPHDWNGSVDASPASEWNSLDLTCNSIGPSCDGTVRAARDGVVHFDTCGANQSYVRIDHLDGWSTTYYHLPSITLAEGQWVARGQALGTIGEGVSCGGSAGSPHVHFSVWYAPNGFSLNGDLNEDPLQRGLEGVDIGGWTVHVGGAQYDGCMVRDSDSNTQCASSGLVFNDGSVGAPGNSVLAAVVGSDNGLYIKQDDQNYQGRQGYLLGAPAVASVPSASGPVALTIVVGDDRRLYVRSDSAGWRVLVQSSHACYDSPGAAVTPSGGGYVLTVACEGSDQGLYYWQTPVSAGALPSVTSGATALGGLLSAGPAVASVNGVVTFVVDGVNNHAVYSRTLSNGYSAVPANCIGHPALGSGAAGTYMACQGLDNQLYYSLNSGSGWNYFRAAGGRLIDGPGVAATSSGMTIYVEQTDTQMYHTVVDAASGTSSGYSADGGILQFGAGAVGLH